jgi:hypothetical protein
VRELLQTLDVWFAAFFAFVGLFLSDADSSLVLGGLLVVVLSTVAQPCPGFDAEAVRTRRALLPLSGLHVLLARDLAWMLVTLPITAPYRLIPCMAGALAALAVGHRALREPPVEQHRWHFAAGHVAPTGLYQILAIILATAGVEQFGLGGLAAAALAWFASLQWYGRRYQG